MIKPITFNRGGSGAFSGRVILPAKYLELMKVTKDEPNVDIRYEDGKIIIEKVEKDMKNLVGKTWGENSEEQKEELFNIANAVDGRTGENSNGGECIVDFDGYEFSIPGKLIIGENEDVIEIDNDAVFYGPTK